MQKKILTYLIDDSMTKGTLDLEKVLTIADVLNRKQLKEYIRALKIWVQENTVIVETVSTISGQTKGEIKDLFSDKDVVFEENPQLILGAKITNNDIIYKMNLHDTLRQLQEYVT